MKQLMLAIIVCSILSTTNAASLSIKVGNSDIETYPLGSTVEVQVGTRVLLISNTDCVWDWEIVNMNSHALTSETNGVLRLLHIVPYTREEAGVYRCRYFNTEYDITLVAGRSNLYRRYGVGSIEPVRNNSVVLLATDIQISCIQNAVLADTSGYWRAPNGSDVGATEGGVYTEIVQSKGEAALYVQGSKVASISEGVYTCYLDTEEMYRILMYRDEYAIIRGSGVRDRLGGGVVLRYVGIGEELTLICPRDSFPEFLGEVQGNIMILLQVIYIPLFTYNEVGVYKCRSERVTEHVELLATGSALLLHDNSLSLLGNDSLLVMSAQDARSVVCAGSISRDGIGSLWYRNGVPVPIRNGTLVQLSSELGGLQLDLSKLTGADQGVYMCIAGEFNGTNQVHTITLYLKDLQLEFVTDTGEFLNNSAVIFLHSRQFSSVTCRSAEFYPSSESVNWTSTPAAYSAVNTRTLDLTEITASGLYTCSAASRYSTGSKHLYILLDNTHANLTLTSDNRTFKFSHSEITTQEIEVGSLNVTIECLAFRPNLVLPDGASYSADETSIQSVAYTIEAMTPVFNGLFSCTGVSHTTTSVRLRAVGVALIRRSGASVSTLNTGISVVETTEDFLCTGSDLNATSGWKESGDSGMYLQMETYMEIFRFIPYVTMEGFYTCQARNETGGVEEITRGLFYSQPYGPDISILINGMEWTGNRYTLPSNHSVILMCNSSSYPLPLSTLWYQDNIPSNYGSSSQLNLTLTKAEISLTCIVRTIFATSEKSITIVNPFLMTTPNLPTIPTFNFTNSSNITANSTQDNPFVILVLLTLVIVVVGPIIALVAAIIIHKWPANAKKHSEKWFKKVKQNLARWRYRRERVQNETEDKKYANYTTSIEKYKEKYGFDVVEEAFTDKKVTFWEPKMIRAEYAEMKKLANIPDLHDGIDEPVRITSVVEVGDDRKREAVEIPKEKEETKSQDTPSIGTQTPSRPSTPYYGQPGLEREHLIPSSQHSSLEQVTPDRDDEKKKQWTKGSLLINIPECPDFIIAKGPDIKQTKKWRRRKKFKDPELEKKVDYLDYLFEKNAEDIVIIAYQPENCSLKQNEIVFYPQGPKDKEKEVKVGDYSTKTKSYFSSEFYTMRQLVIKKKTKGAKESSKTREIRLFHFLTWPKVEVGSRTYPFIEFVRALHSKKQNPVQKKSIVLHCDVGRRSATFISIYYLLKRIEKSKDFNLVQFFCQLNEQVKGKGELFPSYTQYEFLHSIILDLTLNETTCQSSELDTKFKPLFGRPRECIPRIEGRVGLFMDELVNLEKEASKSRAQIQEEKDLVLQALEDKAQRRQRKRAERQKVEKEKEGKGKKTEGEGETQFGLVKEDDSFILDDEIDYINDPRKFIPTLSDKILPEPLFIKKDPAVDRYRKEARERAKKKREQKQRNKSPSNQTTDANGMSDPVSGGPNKSYQRPEGIEEPVTQTTPIHSIPESTQNKIREQEERLIRNTEKEFKQLQMFRAHLLQIFAHPPLYTNYRTHKKHVTGSRDEEVKELKVKAENKSPENKVKDVETNKRELSIEEKLSQDECTRFEQFKFTQRQSQVYGPNIVDENQAQGFWIHSLYGDEIVATRHPCVNDFEFANFNHPQFNLHLYKQQRIPTVVALCTFEELIDAYRAKRNLKYSNAKRDGRQMLTPYWPPVGPENYENFGPFKVETVSTEVLDDDKLMQRYELKYWDTKDLDEYSIQLFLCKDWDTLMETNHTTFRHDRFVHFVTRVLAYTKQTRSDKIAVHCSDTKPYSAMFSAVFYALRQAENEGKIDMYQIVKGIQMSRRQSSVFLEEDQYFLSLKLTSDCLLNVAKARKEMMQDA